MIQKGYINKNILIYIYNMDILIKNIQTKKMRRNGNTLQ